MAKIEQMATVLMCLMIESSRCWFVELTFAISALIFIVDMHNQSHSCPLILSNH